MKVVGGLVMGELDIIPLQDTLTTTIASEIDIIESIRSHLFVKDYLIVTWELVMREMCRNMSGHSRWAVQPLDWR